MDQNRSVINLQDVEYELAARFRVENIGPDKWRVRNLENNEVDEMTWSHFRKYYRPASPGTVQDQLSEEYDEITMASGRFCRGDNCE